MLDYQSDYKILEPTTDLDARRSYWAVGIGLQKIDGVDTSDYLNALVEDTLKGKYSTEEAVAHIAKHYEQIDQNDPLAPVKEADISAARIAKLLEYDDFKLSPIALKSIHKQLFLQNIHISGYPDCTLL